MSQLLLLTNEKKNYIIQDYTINYYGYNAIFIFVEVIHILNILNLVYLMCSQIKNKSLTQWFKF